MPDSIREQIIQRFLALAAGILTASGFETNIGASVFRAAGELDLAALPAINIIPQGEEAIQQYGRDHLTMRLQAEAFVAHGDLNPSVVSEQLLAVLRRGFTSPTLKATGYSPVAITEDFEGTASASASTLTFSKAADSALVTPCAVVTLAGGAEPVRHILAAAGTNAWMTRERGTINAGTAITSIQPPPLVESVTYKTGGTDTYAKAGESVTGCMIKLEIKYSTLIGNPYQQ